MRCGIVVGWAGLLAAAGCGGNDWARVSGTVTVNGKALDNGTVSFHPAEAGPLAYGRIGPGGQYSLKTGTKDGLAVGDYTVTVMSGEIPEEGKKIAVKSSIPAPYLDAKKTPLRFTVAAGSQTIDLPLKGP